MLLLVLMGGNGMAWADSEQFKVSTSIAAAGSSVPAGTVVYQGTNVEVMVGAASGSNTNFFVATEARDGYTNYLYYNDSSTKNPALSGNIPTNGFFYTIVTKCGGWFDFEVRNVSGILSLVDAAGNIVETKDGSSTSFYQSTMYVPKAGIYYLYVKSSALAFYGFKFSTEKTWDFTTGYTAETRISYSSASPKTVSTTVNGTTANCSYAADYFSGLAFQDVINATNWSCWYWHKGGGATDVAGLLNGNSGGRSFAIVGLQKGEQVIITARNESAHFKYNDVNNTHTQSGDTYTFTMTAAGTLQLRSDPRSNYINKIQVIKAISTEVTLSPYSTTYTLGVDDPLTMPTETNTTGSTLSHYTNNSAAVNAGFFRVIGTGTAYVEATAGGEGAVAKMVINSQAATATNTQEENKGTLTFTGQGVYANNVEVLKNSDNETLATVTLGAADGLRLVVDNANSGNMKAMRILDGNGFCQAYPNSANPGGANPIPTVGTFYKIETGSEGGRLSIHAMNVSANTVLKTEAGEAVTMSGSNRDYVAYVAANTIYYLFNDDNDDGKPLYLNAISYLTLKTSDEVSIEVAKLLYKPDTESTGQSLDRTIPCFTWTVTGDAGAKYNAYEKLILRKNGSNMGKIRIEPRLIAGAEDEVLFTKAVIYVTGTHTGDDFTVNGIDVDFDEANNKVYTVDLSATKPNYVEIAFTGTSPEGFTVEKVDLGITTRNGAALNDVFDNSSIAPVLTFSESRVAVDAGSGTSIAAFYTSPASFNGPITYTTDDSSIATYSAGSVSGVAMGSTHLSAKFEGSDYFAPSEEKQVEVLVTGSSDKDNQTWDFTAGDTTDGLSPTGTYEEYTKDSKRGYIFRNGSTLTIPSVQPYHLIKVTMTNDRSEAGNKVYLTIENAVQQDTKAEWKNTEVPRTSGGGVYSYITDANEAKDVKLTITRDNANYGLVIFKIELIDTRLSITPTLTYPSTGLSTTGTSVLNKSLTVKDENGDDVDLTGWTITYTSLSENIEVDSNGKVTCVKDGIGQAKVLITLTPPANSGYLAASATGTVLLEGILTIDDTDGFTINVLKDQIIHVLATSTGASTATLTNASETSHDFGTSEYQWTTIAKADGIVTLKVTAGDGLSVTTFEAVNQTPTVELKYQNAIDDRIVFIGETAKVVDDLEITNEFGQDIKDKYTLTYELIRNDGDASINKTTGDVTTGSTQGIACVRLTITSSNSAYNSRSSEATLWITKNVWYLNNIPAASAASLDGWEMQSGNSNRYNNGNGDWSYLLKKSDGEPLANTMGLQVKNNVSIYANNYLCLFHGNNASVKIPTREGMLLTINARASGDDAEFNIYNVVEGDTYVASSTAKDTEFICTGDYVIIENATEGLDLHIYTINVISDFVLTDGEEVYVPRDATNYQNVIKNAGTRSFKFEVTSDANNIIGSGDLNETTGVISKFSGYGTAEITATCTSEGMFKDQKAVFTVTTVDMSLVFSSFKATLNFAGTDVIPTYGTLLADGTEKSASEDIKVTTIKNDLKGNVFVTSDGTNLNAAILAKVVFSVGRISKNTTIATVTESGGKYIFKADGTGTVTVRAKLSTIEKTFTYKITGSEFMDTNPVIPNTQESYTLSLDAAPDIEVKNVKYYFYDETNKVGGDLDASALELNATTGVITGIKHKADTPGGGGIIPVKAVFDYSDDGGTTWHANEEIVQVITVAYTKNTWNLRQYLEPFKDSDSNYPAPPTTNTTDASGDTDTWKHVVAGSNHFWAYQKKVKGDNGLIAKASAGLLIESEAQKFGTRNDGSGGSGWNFAMQNGSKLIIPHVKPGQWIDIYWMRHESDRGERQTMTNLKDAAGQPITETYRIGNTGMSNTGGYQGSYSFMVYDSGNTDLKYDDDYVDAVIEPIDGGWWTTVRQIVLHDWEERHDAEGYVSTMQDRIRLNQKGGTGSFTPAERFYLGKTSSPVIISRNLNQNSPNAPSNYTWTMDETLKGHLDVSTEDWVNPENNVVNTAYKQVKIDYKGGGWGKLYLTLTSYSHDGSKYVAGRKTWTLTFGKEVDPRKYPYTWDFTKYFENTNTKLSKTDSQHTAYTYDGDEDRTQPFNTTFFDKTTQTWSAEDDILKIVTTGYDNVNTFNYQSYHVDGAELISAGLGGALPETEGLGFSITDKTKGLALDMETADIDIPSTNAPAPAKGPRRASTYLTGEGAGYLSYAGGGDITIPKPETGTFTDYVIYVKSNKQPSSATNATYQDGTSPKVTDAESGVYKYKPDSHADVKLTFPADTKVYMIGVTNILKGMSEVGGKGWATESREINIDPELTSVFTENAVHAYAIDYNSYDLNTASTGMTLVNDGYVQGGNDYSDGAQGVVLYVDNLSNLTDSKVPTINGKHVVPLFPPAITTTAASTTAAFAPMSGNMMYPNVTEQKHTSETQDASGDETKNDYTKFILTNIHWTFAENHTLNEDEVGTVKYADAAGFYRLHIWKTGGVDGGTTLTQADIDEKNTMAANTAYLMVPTELLPTAVWDSQDVVSPTKPASAPRRNTIAIRTSGIVDVDTDEGEDDGSTTGGQKWQNGQWYTLTGMPLPQQPTKPGLYIVNGRKVRVK